MQAADSPNGEVGPGGGGGANFAGGNASRHIKSYECNYCKRGFSNAQALGGHMNIHRRDRGNKASTKQLGLGTNYCYAASSSKGNMDMKKPREDEEGDKRRQLDLEAGELDLELRL